MEKKISFFIDAMAGGGAERVVSVLSNEFILKGYSVDIIMMQNRTIVYSLNDKVHLYYADDMPVADNLGILIRKIYPVWSYFRRRFYIPFLRKIGVASYAKENETSFYYFSKYAIPYREYLKKNKDCTAFGFLIRSNIAMLQAAKGTGVRTVFCERNNPIRPDIAPPMIKIRDHIYTGCKAAVFQTEEERQYYTKLKVKTKVIPNPLKEGLPKRFTGVRRHEIVNFCRLNKQKNIPLLIDAFELFLSDFPDYTLRIYGEGVERENIAKYIKQKNLNQNVFLENFAIDIHELVRDAAMFVFTSDYEGLSNSMLEAMAIGLPCVCTDCAGGGARMMINDHKNGLLVPVGDKGAVYNAMREIASDASFAESISKEAVKIRKKLNIQNIVAEWESLI